MPRSLVPLLLVLLGFAIVVAFLVGSIRSDVRRLRRGSAALQPAQDPPEQGRVFEAPRPEDPLSALRRIAAIDPSSLGIAVLPVAAAIVIGVLAALVGVGFLVIGVVLWLFGPHNLAAWFVVVGSLLAMVAYRSLEGLCEPSGVAVSSSSWTKCPGGSAARSAGRSNSRRGGSPRDRSR